MASAWSVIRSEARIKSNDNTTPYRTADADALTVFNNLLRHWKAKTDPRTRELSQFVWAGGAWGGGHYMDSALKNIREVLRCFNGVSNSITLLSPRGTELEYVEPWEIQLYFDEDTDPLNTGNAVAQRWSYRDLASSTGLGTDVGIKRIWIHPQPTGAGASQAGYILDCRMEPALLVNDTDVPDVTDFECAGLADVLAYEMGRKLGWPVPQMESLRSAVPEEMQFLIQARQQLNNDDRTLDGVKY